MKQPTLFPMGDVELNPTDPNVVPQDKSRLKGQNLKILERLRRGPATTYELLSIAAKYTSRVNDLRNHGYEIDADRGEDGIWTYRLKE